MNYIENLELVPTILIGGISGIILYIFWLIHREFNLLIADIEKEREDETLGR